MGIHVRVHPQEVAVDDKVRQHDERGEEVVEHEELLLAAVRAQEDEDAEKEVEDVGDELVAGDVDDSAADEA